VARSNPYRNDPRTREAKSRGFPARSVFKLEEIDRRMRLLGPGQRVLDLGAAPGSWSMYASRRVGSTGRILAVDMTPIPRSLGANVTVVQGDALSLGHDHLAMFAPYDVVLSDMAPSTTGQREGDAARSAALYLGAVEVAAALLAQGGAFVGKIFMGAEFEASRARTREVFGQVRVIRPAGTRPNSVEVFLVGLQKR